MKKFIFYKKNGNAIISLTAKNFEEADNKISEIVINPNNFVCENEDGE